MYPRIALTCLFCLAVVRDVSGTEAAALWADQVQAIFDIKCIKCHGPLDQKSELGLDTPAAAMRGGAEGAVVVPGRPEKSRLYLYLDPNSDPHMPPKKQLSDAERASVHAWITAMARATDPSEETPSPEEAPSFESVTQAIDAFVAAGWQRRGIEAAAAADDRTWCRRVTLDLAGRIPTHGELEAFLFSPSKAKRVTLVEQLLVSDEYAQRMRELWDTLLMGRGKRRNPEERRIDSGWWAFLEDAFRENRPWNETVHDFLCARPDTPETRGAIWFLYERRNRHQAIAEAVAPVVYGTRIDCAQCHDHPLAREIKQGHYWGLVAAFNRGQNVKGNTEVAESAVGGFINFTNLEKESRPAVVTLLTGHTVEEARPAAEEQEQDSDDKYVDPAADVRVPKFSRRAAFADAATQENPLLARAFVNRMWGALLGRGIVHPADEMNARNAPSHPQLLDWLAQDFAAHRYDVRRLVQGIVLSRAYGLSSKEAAPDSFATTLERPLAAEQIARSWRIAMGLSPDDDALRRAVITAMPDVLPAAYTASFQQAQFLSSSPDLAEILKPASGDTVERLVALGDTPSRIRAAFVAVHGRWPDDEESARVADFLQERPGPPADAMRDLLWALMTSAEFLTMP